jgi:hypothetical protein
MSEGGNGKLNTPAFERIHQLPWRIQTLAHQRCLLAHSDEGILEEPGLVLGGRGGRHGIVGVVATLISISPAMC